ncbi:protein kinase domain-containing protein [Tautonia plasticadhaerens]|uniref:Serine/threonine-protein kinase PknD n=1 Tax=Tautonia plasticadhaerens TaxID=2527974 RepID=A0A518H3E8_9BACT|nr:protein kinase [Tautonia plasticadhaerens]QDV35362.1 Serine/threonine-protein kinase PknD [Tautonia plasticadhaerens]
MDIDRNTVFTDLARRSGLIDPARLSSASEQRKETGEPLDEVLVRLGDLSPEDRDALLLRVEAVVLEHADDPEAPWDAASGTFDTLDLAGGAGASPPPSEPSLPRFEPTVSARARPDPPAGFDPEATSGSGPSLATAPGTGRGDAEAGSSREALRVDPEATSPMGSAPTVEAQPPGSPSVGSSGGVGWGGSGSRFRVVREHAKGGLGSVLVAFDEELRREVALKEIQERHADDPDSRSRFLVEAEITGGLEHPGVVPVYSLGRNPDGRPFYAMRFIRGESLRKAIERFHDPERGPKDPVGRTLQLRGLLRRFVDVCNALEYAHSRGVIHRDIKPDNIMLGPYGETLLVDWGLAKPVDRVDSPSNPPTAELPLRPTSVAVSTPTIDGSAVGTPAFMSPEQAEGNHARMGPTSDVYSLGATLYQLLAGAPPFTDRKLIAILHKVRKGEFPPPRRLKAEVPPALEAICLKAMARSGADRYPSCLALADDLEHWLADEPVSVYREPLAARAFRWARRHRTAVTAAAALVAVLVPVLAASALLIGRERDRAESMEGLARSAVEDMYLDVAEAVLGDISDPREEAYLNRALARLDGPMAPAGFDGNAPEAAPEAPEAPPIDDALRGPLREALDYYEGFARGGGIGPSAAVESARARTRIGDITARLGRFDEAEASYRLALEILRPIAARRGSEAEPRRRLAEAQARLGALLAVLGRPGEAEPMLRDAIGGRQTLLDTPPPLPEDELGLVEAEVELAELLKLSGRVEEAEDAYRHAISRLRPMADAPDAEVSERRELAAAADGLGVLLLMLGRDAEAEPMLRLALDGQRGLLVELPTVPRIREGLAKTSNSLGLFLRRDGRPGEAEEMLRSAIGHYDRLADDFPGRVEYRRALARGHLNLGVLLQSEGKVADAEAAFRRAVGHYETLQADAPEAVKVRRDLVTARSNLGGSLQLLGRPEEAVGSLDDAVLLADALAGEFPDVPDLRAGLATALVNRGSLRDLLGEVEASEADLARAAEQLGRLVAEVPGRPSYLRELAACEAATGLALAHGGQPEAAEASYASAADRFEALLRQFPEDRDLKTDLATCLNNRANLKLASAGPSLRRALGLFEELAGGRDAPGPKLARDLGVVHYNLGEHLAEAGDPEAGEPEYAEGARLLAEAAAGPGGSAETRSMAAVAATDYAGLLVARGAIDEAIPVLQGAIPLARDAATESPIAPNLIALFDASSALVAAHLASGQYMEAARVATRLAESVPGQLALRSRSAVLLARCVEAIRGDTGLAPAEADRLAREAGDRAVAQVRVALDAGYNPDSLRKLADQLGPLLDRDDFNALLSPGGGSESESGAGG